MKAVGCTAGEAAVDCTPSFCIAEALSKMPLMHRGKRNSEVLLVAVAAV